MADDSEHTRSVCALALDILGYDDRKVLDDLLMVRIPAGKFKMGGGGYAASDLHVAKTEGYFIDRFPLTNGQYSRFAQAGGYDDPQWWSEEGWRAKNERSWTGPAEYIDRDKLNHPTAPVVGISQYEAEACAKQMGKRLPSEEEWERAARGDEDEREYPWGPEWKDGHCNTWESGIGSLSPAGSFPQGISPHGLWDTSGNVLEWTSSPFAEEDLDPVVRGGSFGGDQLIARCTDRGWLTPGGRYYFLGVRFSRTLTPNS